MRICDNFFFIRCDCSDYFRTHSLSMEPTQTLCKSESDERKIGVIHSEFFFELFFSREFHFLNSMYYFPCCLFLFCCVFPVLKWWIIQNFVIFEYYIDHKHNPFWTKTHVDFTFRTMLASEQMLRAKNAISWFQVFQ